MVELASKTVNVTTVRVKTLNDLAQLYGNGFFVGGLWDMASSDKYQDNPPTVVASSTNDPVKYVADRSGNGNHMSVHSGTDAERPLLKLDNGTYTLADGTDDNLASDPNADFPWDSFDLTDADEVWLFACVSMPSGSTTQRAFEFFSTTTNRLAVMRGKIECRLGGSALLINDEFGWQSDARVYSVRLSKTEDVAVIYIDGAECSRFPLSANWFNSAVGVWFHCGNQGSAFSASKFWVGGCIARPLTPARHQEIVSLLAAKANYTPTVNGKHRGAWSWFAHPSFIEVSGTKAVCFTDAMGGTRLATPSAVGDISSSLLLGRPSFKDDHNNGTLLIRASDSRVLCFHCGHNKDEILLNVSTNPNDVTAWGAPTDIGAQLGLQFYSYPRPVHLTGMTNSPIYLFYRASTTSVRDNAAQWYSFSTDGGTTWNTGTNIIDDFRSYLSIVQSSTTRVDIACSDGHPAEEGDSSLYHFYFDNGTFYTTGGTPLTLPIDPATDLTPIWSYSSTNEPTWPWQIKVDGSGHPVIVYATIVSSTNHRYRYSRWNGSAWVTSEVAAGGETIAEIEPAYSGGICIDPDDVNTVYYSRKTGDHFQIFKRTTADGGATWGTETQITSEAVNHIRPFCIDTATEPRIVVMKGDYANSFYDFETYMGMINSA